MDKDLIIQEIINLLKVENIGRKTVAKLFNLSERKANEYLAIAKYLLEKENKLEIEDIEEETPKPQKYQIQPQPKIAILSDIHFPFNINLKPILNFLSRYKPNLIILNGDIVDFYEISMFIKDKSINDINLGIEKTIDFIKTIRNFYDNIIYYRIGNHEERLIKYLWDKPSIKDYLEFEKLFLANELNIKFIYKQDLLFTHNLNIFHGHELNLNNVKYVAERILERYSCNIIVGHFHNKQERIKYKLENGEYTPIGAWVSGCLCQKPLYNIHNTYFSNGFVLVEYFDENFFQVKNILVIKDKILI